MDEATSGLKTRKNTADIVVKLDVNIGVSFIEKATQGIPP